MKLLPPLSRKALLLSVAVCSCVAASCSRGQVAEDKPAETVPVQELVAQADKYYASRDKIENAGEAVAVMRGARRSDYGHYEGVRKLSKYNYYLGVHEAADQPKLDSL